MSVLAWWILIGCFSAPLLRLFRSLWSGLGFQRTGINGALGFFERHGSRLREFLVVTSILVFLVSLGEGAYLWSAVAFALVLLARQQRFYSEMRAAEWMRLNARLLPRDFFAACNQEWGPAGCPHNYEFERQDSGLYDFRDEKASPSRFVIFQIFVTSAWMTRIIIQAESWLGPKYYLELFDHGARIWSLVVLAFSRSVTKTEGMDQLKELPVGAKRLFLFNHVSMTDFALGFSALDQFVETERKVKLKFVIAKDHFIDNPLIYSIGGIGRCIELAGMVPIDRKNSKNAVVALEGAAKIVADNDIDLAIYPQGTRSFGQFNSAGELVDAGYYSSAKIERAAEPLGHIKKGTAFMALDVLRALKDSETPVHLVIVGIQGAGTLIPKGSLKMNRGANMIYRVSEIITLETKDLRVLEKYDGSGEVKEEEKAQAEELTARIDAAMAKAVCIDERLKELYKEVVGQEMPESAFLRRLFDHALSVPVKDRQGLLDTLRGLPEAPSDEDLQPLYKQLIVLRSKSR